MKIVMELNASQRENPTALAAMLGVNAEALAQAAVADQVSATADDPESAASRVLEKNRTRPYRPYRGRTHATP